MSKNSTVSTVIAPVAVEAVAPVAVEAVAPVAVVAPVKLPVLTGNEALAELQKFPVSVFVEGLIGDMVKLSLTANSWYTVWTEVNEDGTRDVFRNRKTGIANAQFDPNEIPAINGVGYTYGFDSKLAGMFSAMELDKDTYIAARAYEPEFGLKVSRMVSEYISEATKAVKEYGVEASIRSQFEADYDRIVGETVLRKLGKKSDRKTSTVTPGSQRGEIKPSDRITKTGTPSMAGKKKATPEEILAKWETILDEQGIEGLCRENLRLAQVRVDNFASIANPPEERVKFQDLLVSELVRIRSAIAEMERTKNWDINKIVEASMPDRIVTIQQKRAQIARQVAKRDGK